MKNVLLLVQDDCGLEARLQVALNLTRRMLQVSSIPLVFVR